MEWRSTSQGLSKQLKDELAARDEPPTLDSLTSLTVRMDNRWRQCQKERGNPSTAPRPPPFPVRSPQQPPFSLVTMPTKPAASHTVQTPADPEPMQLGQTRLTPEGRRRHLAVKECLYMVIPSFHCCLHRSAKRVGSHADEEQWVSLTHSWPFRPNCLTVPVSLSTPSGTIQLLTLFDSRAEDHFIDKLFVPQANFPTESLERPIVVQALDRKEPSLVARQSPPPLHILVSSNHGESLSFKILSSPAISIVLGHPWLVRHNPHFDWAAGHILNWGMSCFPTCLQSAHPPKVKKLHHLSLSPLTSPVFLPCIMTSLQCSARTAPSLCLPIGSSTAPLILFQMHPSSPVVSTTSLVPREKPWRNTLLIP